ncbi:MAG TPA: leucyl/phenylalanyl-tRNA--protein transferase [Smithella sp.]|nr:leucyl/phenylalanyl-tRNA--protein transferase [Smithella sp.]HOU51986.1 leucyl/phenylalanyl-tRNA--protein transferase [Smithella sp.]HQG66080.1 leucyl/phenylalanyl-tRNA--protein transferase [Smithella sp.]HQI73480.1 leucyl/phenylalanyl-tRNA--protein transferase [Smithella sp.]
MTVYRLTKKLAFPPPELADDDGLLAVGGDLSVNRLVLAYSMGIFPWSSDDTPILWWSPDPRPVIFPGRLKIPRTLRQTMKKGIFRITTNAAFEDVIRNCATISRKGQDGTWINHDMIEAYIRLHKAGYAHSVEAWDGDELAGGLYGIILGRAFFGESMFAKKSDASKVAFATYALTLAEKGFELIDCQVTTAHMKRFGAVEISREEFMNHLQKALHVEA